MFLEQRDLYDEQSRRTTECGIHSKLYLKGQGCPECIEAGEGNLPTPRRRTKKRVAPKPSRG